MAARGRDALSSNLSATAVVRTRSQGASFRSSATASPPRSSPSWRSPSSWPAPCRPPPRRRPVRAADDAAPGGRLVVLWRDHAPSPPPAVRASGRSGASASGQRTVVAGCRGRAGELAATAPGRSARPRRRAGCRRPCVRLARRRSAVRSALRPTRATSSRSTSRRPGRRRPATRAWSSRSIDSGVDLTHPDLAGVTVVAPRNETFNNTDVTDAGRPRNPRRGHDLRPDEQRDRDRRDRARQLADADQGPRRRRLRLLLRRPRRGRLGADPRRRHHQPVARWPPHARTRSRSSSRPSAPRGLPGS